MHPLPAIKVYLLLNEFHGNILSFDLSFRFYQTESSSSGYAALNISSSPVTQQDIQSILDSDLVTTPTEDNRAGIEGTLHRLG